MKYIVAFSNDKDRFFCPLCLLGVRVVSCVLDELIARYKYFELFDSSDGSFSIEEAGYVYEMGYCVDANGSSRKREFSIYSKDLFSISGIPLNAICAYVEGRTCTERGIVESNVFGINLKMYVNLEDYFVSATIPYLFGYWRVIEGVFCAGINYDILGIKQYDPNFCVSLLVFVNNKGEILGVTYHTNNDERVRLESDSSYLNNGFISRCLMCGDFDVFYY